MKHWVPDYANMGSTNLIASSASFTVAENGFIEFELRINHPGKYVVLKINGKDIVGDAADLDNRASYVRDIVEVAKEDIVSVGADGSFYSKSAYFIPGRWV